MALSDGNDRGTMEPNPFCKLSMIAKNLERMVYGLHAGRGVSEKASKVGFCLGSGLFGSCNSN